MKTKYLLFSIFSLMIALSCAKDSTNVPEWTDYSDYIPLPEKEAVWINSVHSEDIALPGDFPNTRTLTNQYYINGDTLINNISYIKIYNHQLVKNYYYESNSYSYDSTIFYSGAFRQNIQTKKVYFFFASDNHEQLIYDFDLNIGDTVPVYKVNETTKGVVICIDSTLIGNRYHTVFYILQGSIVNDFSYIEGVGSSIGLILESKGSLFRIYEASDIKFKYKGENLVINWKEYPENCN